MHKFGQFGSRGSNQPFIRSSNAGYKKPNVQWRSKRKPASSIHYLDQFAKTYIPAGTLWVFQLSEDIMGGGGGTGKIPIRTLPNTETKAPERGTLVLAG
jgi:hypothetical protein